jgi:hypothetical protein
LSLSVKTIVMPREKLTTHALRTDGRLEHGAVPLDPWRATHAPGVPDWQNLYVSGSATRIERRLTRNMVEGEWFKHVPQAHQLFEMMRESLIDSQNRRIDMNSRAQMKDISPEGDERVVRALEGTATPEELFTLLVDMPEIGSLELAKLSHPFDFGATDTMDRQMDDLMLTSEGELLDEDPRYKLKRVNQDIPAGIILRKQDLMDFPITDGVVRIVQRRGFLVFQGEGKENEPHFDRLLKNPKNHRALFAMTESTINDSPGVRPFGWVQPQATSYYAKFVATSPIDLTSS